MGHLVVEILPQPACTGKPASRSPRDAGHDGLGGFDGFFGDLEGFLDVGHGLGELFFGVGVDDHQRLALFDPVADLGEAGGADGVVDVGRNPPIEASGSRRISAGIFGTHNILDLRNLCKLNAPGVAILGNKFLHLEEKLFRSRHQ